MSWRIAGDIQSTYDAESAAEFIKTYNKNSTSILIPSRAGTSYPYTEKVNSPSIHSEIHQYIGKVFGKGLEWLEKNHGPLLTQGDLDHAAAIVAGFHNGNHKDTQILIEPKPSDISCNIIKITVADSTTSKFPWFGLGVKQYRGPEK